MKKKKAFTIIELVIVIAVIGILTAILIPVFINLTERANEANDEALVRNVNIALATEEQQPRDKKNITLYDAINDLNYYGYNEANLFPKGKNRLLWNELDNRYYLSNKLDENVKHPSYWELIKTSDVDGDYSRCFASGYSETSLTNITYSVDVGKNKTITNLSYVNNTDHSLMTTIKTNDENNIYITAMNVNGHLTCYRHYGNLSSLVIDNAKEYHEYGNVLNHKVTVHEGKIFIYPSSNIDTVVVTDNDVVTIENYKDDLSIDLANADRDKVIIHNHTEDDPTIIDGHISSQSELLTAITETGHYQLVDDFTITEDYITISTPLDVVIDLNGHNITHQTSSNTQLFKNYSNLTLLDTAGGGSISSNYGLVRNEEGATTHIYGGSYNATDPNDDSGTSYYPSLFRPIGGSIIIEDGTFYSKRNLVRTGSGSSSMIINGGTFTVETDNAPAFDITGTSSLIINNMDFSSNYCFLLAKRDANVVINNGTFNIDLASSAFHQDRSAIQLYLDSPATIGAKVEINNGNFIYKADHNYFAFVGKDSGYAISYGSDRGLYINGTTNINVKKNDDSTSTFFGVCLSVPTSTVTIASTVTCNTSMNNIATYDDVSDIPH